MRVSNMIIKYDNNCSISMDMSKRVKNSRLIDKDIPFSQNIEEIQFPANAEVLYTEWSTAPDRTSLMKDNSSLKKIFIPEGIKEVDQKVVSGCPNLKNIAIPNSIEYVNSEAFFGSNNIKTVADNNHAYYLTLDGTDASPKTLLYKTDWNTIVNYVAPGSLKAIVDFAFSSPSASDINDKLEIVDFRCDLKVIPDSAFARCTSLSKMISDLGDEAGVINLPSTIKKISLSAFSRCASIDKVHIGKNIEVIESGAFRNCTNLTEVIIDKEVSSTDQVPLLKNIDVFENCSNLKTIWVPLSSLGYYKQAENWSYYADIVYPLPLVEKTPFNYFIVEEIGSRHIGRITGLSAEGQLAYDQGKIDQLNFPSTYSIDNNLIVEGSQYPIYEIDDEAFKELDKLKLVVFINTYQYGCSIGDKAFFHCHNLETVIIGKYARIGSGAFSNCHNLSTLSLGDIYIQSNLSPIEVREISLDALASFAGTKLFKVQDKLKYLSTIDNNCYLIDKANLDTIELTIPSDNIYIGAYAFKDHENLVSINLSKNTKIIDSYAFSGCTNLQSISVPSSIELIRFQAFAGCTKLTSITIKKSITSSSGAPNLGQSAFDNTNNCPIYVPADSVNYYKAATHWSKYAARIKAIQE